MKRFVEGIERGQATLFPECLEDWIDEDNPVRVIDALVEKLDLSRLGFDGVAPEATGRPWYPPAMLLSFTSTATSIGSSQVGALSVRLCAMSR